MKIRLNSTLVQHALIDRKMTGRDLAALAGVGEATIYRIMNGDGFHSKTLGKIAGVLECDPRDLISTEAEIAK